MSKIYKKVKPNLTNDQRFSYGISAEYIGRVICVSKIISHYTDNDFVVSLPRGRELIIPSSCCVDVTPEEITKASWFPTRPLDINTHPKTSIFKSSKPTNKSEKLNKLNEHTNW